METVEPIEKQETRNLPNQGLKIALLVTFLAAVLLTAYLTYAGVRDFVATWRITNLPGVSIQDAAEPIAPAEDGVQPVSDAQTPLQPQGGPTPEPWDGAKPVTLLVMGLDYRDWVAGEGAPRTDTMILFMLDPVNRSISMLNIPRDLWVNIPGGFNYGRINTAYMLGEANALPGGGPGLAMETVEELLGVPIDYYAQIDFSAFERFIDEIGGVKIDILEPIKIDPLGDDNTKKLKAGKQVLNGSLALAYARARKTEGGDFDRAERQQQVVMAIRNRIVSGLLPLLITKAPALYNELSKGVRTNLTLDDAIRLAWLGIQIPEEAVKKAAIGPDQVSFAVSPDGEQQVLKPITEKIRLLRDEVFTYGGPVGPATSNSTPEELMKAENARVRILNGTQTAGLASRTMEYLKSLGVNITESGNADQVKPYSEITLYNGKPYTVKYLVDLFRIDPIRIRYVNDPASPVDVTVTLGEDWAATNPMP